jgi:hypothetical protein
MKKYIFDTNIFNAIYDRKISIDVFVDLDLFVTHIQYDEILKTSDSYRRKKTS